MFEDAIKDLEDHLQNDPKRLNHIKGVFKTALYLAKYYQIDEYEVGLAALYHDYHKNESKEFFKQYLGDNLFNEYREFSVMYHALAAEKTLMTKYPHLSTNAYLAVKNHIFGNVKMSMIEKIVFISDYAEPSRKFLDTQYLLQLSLKDIDQAVLYCINLTINDLNKRNLIIHQQQIDALNYYKRKVEDNDR